MPASSLQAQQAPAALRGPGAAFIASLATLMLQATTGPPPAAQRASAVPAFAVIVRITEAVSCEVTSVIIVAMIALPLGSAATRWRMPGCVRPDGRPVGAPRAPRPSSHPL